MKNKKKKSRKISINVKRTFLILFSVFVTGTAVGMFLLYGPYSGFRRLLITTAMTTKSHQYLATWWYSDEEINKVLANNYVVK